jgi:hypothetical protein
MSIKLPCALFAASLLAIAQAPARLGETAEQCEKRYGKPEDSRVELPIEKRIIYRKDGRTVTADFVGGKVVTLHFNKKGIEKWAIHEIDLKLREHGGGLPWGKPRASTSPIETILIWRRSDRIAHLSSEGESLVFIVGNINQIHADYRDKKAAADKAGKAKADKERKIAAEEARKVKAKAEGEGE